MKYSILALLGVVSFLTCHAQTNTFPASGHVGVGTTAPQSRLHVVGGGVSIAGANTQSGVNGFQNFLQLVNPNHAAILYNPGLPTQLMFGFHSNGNMYWGSSNSYTMMLTNMGHLRVSNSLSVGGELKAGSRLSVDGKLAAKEVEVSVSNWPDYVFHKGYNLMSLDSVERFINDNGHLPEMPKAADVESSGVQLGVMITKLLKKNEELTLHLIEQQKQITRLQEQLSSAKSK